MTNRIKHKVGLAVSPLLLVVIIACGNTTDDQSVPETGDSLMKKGQYEQAIEKFDKAIKLNPDEVANYASRGAAFNMLRRYKRAIKEYDEVIKFEPKNPDAHGNRG